MMLVTQWSSGYYYYTTGFWVLFNTINPYKIHTIRKRIIDGNKYQFLLSTGGSHHHFTIPNSILNAMSSIKNPRAYLYVAESMELYDLAWMKYGNMICREIIQYREMVGQRIVWIEPSDIEN